MKKNLTVQGDNAFMNETIEDGTNSGVNSIFLWAKKKFPTMETIF